MTKAQLHDCVLHFGEMASRWGFNRSVGQVLALVVFSEAPLCADDISEALGISRGNVSMAAKELQSWRLIRVVRSPGDRKDYYGPNGSLWDMAQQVLSERRKREVDPTLSLLRGQLMLQDDQAPSYATQRMQEIHDLLELFTRWLDDVQRLKPAQLQALLKLGAGVGRVLELKDKVFR
ncbi:GbsR/MarR family transcriptional regulator [Simiduia sp. 21SJ11W-1]|uniref:GbsR/MarR family transcriptional regulator n=1 Tax=Simiduia sp. 21SJ11W-1 TaxID=2909669 RepID=UPI00209CE406|nr:GbsR/MarR family transcriptional regulator [Simiduia sp. 21SJ11W-1]UTA48958.1 GbsR/MarR family transcriptional regulator [Simiduia sp. 21SJ11W-1]